MIKALREIEVMTLFVEDLAATRSFYQDVFGLAEINGDEVSSLLAMDNLMINLLEVSESSELVTPAAVASPSAGARCLLTIKVDDVDGTCVELRRHGVTLLNGPIDRPWGRRTVAFADPAGNVWEIAQDLPSA